MARRNYDNWSKEELAMKENLRKRDIKNALINISVLQNHKGR